MATVLFAFAHQDDETLAAGVAIAEHVVAGHDVHVLCLSTGATSGVLDVLNGVGANPWWGVPHNPAAEGYPVLTEAQFVAARNAELVAAVNCLGSVTIHYGNLTVVTPATVAAEIERVADVVAPTGPVILKTHSHLVDVHPDHIAAGQAAVNLKASQPARFGDVRHYILPRYWDTTVAANRDMLALVVEKWDTPTNADIKARATNAARCYGAWAPPASYAIGYHSVWTDMFAPLLASPGPRSLYHP